MAESLPLLKVCVKQDCSGAIIYGVTKRAGHTILESNDPGQLLAHLGLSPNLEARTKNGNELVEREDIQKVKAHLDAEIDAAEKAEAKKKEKALKEAQKADEKKEAEVAKEKAAAVKEEEEVALKAAKEKDEADKAAAEAEAAKKEAEGKDDKANDGGGNGTAATLTLKDDDKFPAGNVGNDKLQEFAENYNVTAEQLSAEGRDSYSAQYDWLKAQFGL